MGDPVEAAHALESTDTGADDEDVVAALGVVVVVAAAAEQHVVAVGTDRVVLERSTCVTLDEVGLTTALEPVVAFVTEQDVEGVAAEEEVVAGAGDDLAGIDRWVGKGAQLSETVASLVKKGRKTAASAPAAEGASA